MRRFAPLLAVTLLAAPLAAQSFTTIGGRPAADTTCRGCAAWLVPHAPVRLHANTWYVGSAELSALLVTSPSGHVLLDGGLPGNAPQILANIRAAGVDPRDVKLIVNSHVHYDHAGGIAALQRATGAEVAALDWSARVLRRGMTLRDDPQAPIHFDYPAVPRVRTIRDGDTLRVGPLALVAHATPGHTPGGTTWTWRACDGADCVDVVYADSQNPISADGFRYSDTPATVRAFRRGHARIAALPCGLLVTPHPGVTGLWARVAARDAGDPGPLRDPDACRRYAADAAAALAARLARERGASR
jgi:metallo-beta-lactamase class B